jgi:hypothetical protein
VIPNLQIGVPIRGAGGGGSYRLRHGDRGAQVYAANGCVVVLQQVRPFGGSVSANEVNASRLHF